MGASASRIGGTKESLYELLQVSPDADSAELKKAYRARALELHPDRNYANEEEATALFAKVQAAYDLLTDENERQWYDQHRKNHKYNEYDGNLTTAADVRAACAETLAKPKLDFEAVAAHFEKLRHEEQEAIFEQGIEPTNSIIDAPVFGGAADPWPRVRGFYDHWSAFNTLKSYTWEDIYPLHTAQDRRTRRKFEQTNKKVRDAAKREFSAAVRQAVLLLKQRDPRRPGETSSANRAKQEEFISKEQEKRAEHQRNLRETYTDQEWQKPAEIEGNFEVGEQPETECVICESTFETEFDLQDHLKTNKHKRAVMQMKAQLMKEDEMLGSLSLNDTPPNQDDESAKKPGKAKAKAKKKAKGQHILTCGTCGLELPGEELIAHKRLTRHP